MVVVGTVVVCEVVVVDVEEVVVGSQVYPAAGPFISQHLSQHVSPLRGQSESASVAHQLP